MVTKNIPKVKVTDKSIIIRVREGSTTITYKIKRNVSLIEFIDTLVTKGIFKYEKNIKYS